MKTRISLAALLTLLVCAEAHAVCNTLPTITLSPSYTESPAGRTVDFDFTVKNNDYSAFDCKPLKYTVSTGSGGGYYPYPQLLPELVEIGPVVAGETFTTQLHAVMPGGAPVGTYFNDTVYVSRSGCTAPRCQVAAYSLTKIIPAQDVCIPAPLRDELCALLDCECEVY